MNGSQSIFGVVPRCQGERAFPSPCPGSMQFADHITRLILPTRTKQPRPPVGVDEAPLPEMLVRLGYLGFRIGS